MSGTSIIAQIFISLKNKITEVTSELPSAREWYIFSLIYFVSAVTKRDKYLSNNTGTTHYDSLHGSYWADQKDSRNVVIMTSLQGQ